MSEGRESQPQPLTPKYPENRLLVQHIKEVEQNLFDIPHFYFGGVAVDGVLGTETRPHDDLDIWVISREVFEDAKQRLINLDYREPTEEEIKEKLKWVKDDATRLIHEDETEIDLGVIYEEDENIFRLPIEALDGNLFIPKQALEGRGNLGNASFPTFTKEALYLLKHGAIFSSRKMPFNIFPMWVTSRIKDRQDFSLLKSKINPNEVQDLLNAGWRYEGQNPYVKKLRDTAREFIDSVVKK